MVMPCLPQTESLGGEEDMAQRIMEDRYPIQTPKQYELKEEDIANNSSRRVPIIVCVDCSYSMRQNNRLKRVVEGLESFLRDMDKDELARHSVELCLISYGGVYAKVECDFTTPDRIKLPDLKASGETPLGDAVELALENWETYKQRYEENGITWYRPWLVLIGDGDETGSTKQLENAAQRLKEESAAKHLNVLCVMVGDEDKVRRESGSLMQLAPDGKVQYLRDLKFREFFGWLSRSIQKNSQSLSGEEAQYEPTGEWAEILDRWKGDKNEV